MPRLSIYVEHGGEIACRHPADALDSRLYGFLLPADRERLDAFCDHCFNVPSGGAEHWRAVGDEVLLNFVDIPTMGSTDPLDQALGVCHEREVAIWFPIFDRHRGRLAWAIPYMFVDSTLAFAGGREVYGFPKQMGTLHIPVGSSAPDELAINTVTLATYLPTSVAEDHRVISVTRAGAEAPLVSGWGQLGAGLRQLGGEVSLQRLPGLPDLPATALFFTHLVEEDVPMLLLKQFRDAHVPGAACYQAIVRVDMIVKQFRGGGLLPDYDVRVAPLDGEPITRELGVPSASRPRVAFWMDFDFIVDLGDILWEAGVG